MACWCGCRYAVLLLVVNYVAPLSALVITYSIIGKQLWGSQAIGERTPGQEETIRSKRRVCISKSKLSLYFNELG